MGKIDMEQLPKLWRAGLPSKDIAARFGVKYPAVNIAAQKLGLPPRRKGGDRRSPDLGATGNPVNPNELRAMLDRGMTLRAIADRMDWAYPSVVRWAAKVRGTQQLADAPKESGVSVPDGLDPLRADLLRSGGKNRALCDVAARHGIPITRAFQLWHGLRVSA